MNDGLILHGVKRDSLSDNLKMIFNSDFNDCSLLSSKIGLSIYDKEALDLVNESAVLRWQILCRYSLETGPNKSPFKKAVGA